MKHWMLLGLLAALLGFNQLRAQAPNDCVRTPCTYLPLIVSRIGPTGTPTDTAVATATATTTPTVTQTPQPPTATATPTVTQTPQPPMIQNGDFEQGNVAWSTFSGSGAAIITQTNLPMTPRSGQWVAWLGGSNSGALGSLSQAVTLPSGQMYSLQFYHQIRSTQVCDFLPDFARIKINDAVVHQGAICSTFNVTTWSPFTIDLSSYAGQTVTISFEVLNYSSPASSSFFVDDVSLVPNQ